MTRAELIALVTSNIYANNNNEVTAPMVRDSILAVIAFMGDAATYNVGAVEQGGTTLVTGGTVYSAINTALSAAVKFQGVTTTALYDGATTNPITIDGASYTARKGDEVINGGKEFLWTGTKWQQLGDEESWALKTVTISAGTGLTGGGDLTANRTISLSQDSIDKLALAASAYQLPATGIPKTDLAAAVQTTLGNADTVVGYFTSGILGSTHLPSMYVGRTQVAFSAANATLLGIDAISNAASSGNADKSRIVWDNTNKAWHFLGSIYADGFVSGGGLSSGGGTGGIDLDAMWTSLTTTSDAHGTDKIAAGHIPDIASTYGYLKSADLSAYATRTWVGDNYLPLSGGTLLSFIAAPGFKTNGISNYSGVFRGSTWTGSLGVDDVVIGVNDTTTNKVILSAKYVGIKTFNPQYDLDVNGTFNATTIYQNGTTLANTYLPLTGGTITGGGNYPLSINTTSTENILRFYVSSSQVAAFAWQSGTYGVYMQNAAVSGTPYVNIASDGVFKYNNAYPFLHSNNYSSYALPLTGGTLNGTVAEVFKINTSNENNLIQFQSGGSIIGDVGYVTGGYGMILRNRAVTGLPFINIASDGNLKYNNTYLYYHSGNSNSTSVAWSASSLTLNGAISGATNISASNGIIAGGDTSGVYFGSAKGGLGSSYTGGLAYVYGNNPLYFYTASTQRMIVTGEGKVGIGTPTPACALDVSGEVSASTKLTSRAWFINTDTYVSRGNLITGGLTADDIGIWANGHIVRAWCSTFNIQGNLTATGAVTGGQASDARLKTNIASMTDNQAMGLIMALRPVTFTWNQKATELFDQYKGDDLGFIAQEVEGIPGLSKAIGTIFEDYKRLDPVKFIAPIVKVAQNHETRIQQLERELAQVKNENKQLRNRLNMS